MKIYKLMVTVKSSREFPVMDLVVDPKTKALSSIHYPSTH